MGDETLQGLTQPVYGAELKSLSKNLQANLKNWKIILKNLKILKYWKIDVWLDPSKKFQLNPSIKHF